MSKREIRKSLPPGPKRPAFLQLAGTWNRPGASTMKLLQRYGRRVTVQLPFMPPMVLLSDPDEIKELFTAPPDAVHPGEGARLLEPLLGQYSLILLDEDIHMEHRKLLLPAFHGERMRALVGLMSELTEKELDSWPLDEPIGLHGRLQQLTLEIILRAVFGLASGARLDELRETLTEILAFAEKPMSVMLPTYYKYLPWLPMMRHVKKLQDRTDELIFDQVHERRAEMGDSTETDAPDVLSMLLAARHEDGSPMSDRELRDELMTALVAGHETTASQLSWMFMHLAREPRVVRELRAEMETGESDAYLMATIHELMRLRPVLPNAEPRVTQQEYTVGGVTYPKGVALMASSYMMHHDPELYPDPYAFKPERFLGKNPGTYSWIPFGGGRRRCLGASFALQEMKVVIPAVLRRFELAPGVAGPERTRRRSITLSPANGCTVVLHERPAVAAVTGDSGYHSEHGSAGTDQGGGPLPAEAALAGSSVRDD